MRINIYVFGRFHAFDLAKQLEKSGLINKIVSTYPYFIGKKWNIKRSKFKSWFLFEILVRINRKTKIIDQIFFTNCFKSIFSKLNYFSSKESNIHISWSNSSYQLFKRLRKRQENILILERGSTHQSFQNDILFEEYNLFKTSFDFDFEATRNELIEYEISDYIVVPSNFVKKTFLEKGINSEKIFVNPYGVNLADFKKVEIKKDKFRIIFVGKACLRKGFQYLIEAMKKLEQYEIELWHVGSVSEEIKTLDFKLKNITYHGSKPQNKLYEYYNQCDVFVLPSLEDGFGMVILQAMACGLPVICSTNTGIENVLTKNGEEGFIIPIRDPNAIVERVLELYNNKELRTIMGNKALKKVQNGFTWDDYGNRYIDFLKKISNE